MLRLSLLSHHLLPFYRNRWFKESIALSCGGSGLWSSKSPYWKTFIWDVLHYILTNQWADHELAVCNGFRCFRAIVFIYRLLSYFPRLVEIMMALR